LGVGKEQQKQTNKQGVVFVQLERVDEKGTPEVHTTYPTYARSLARSRNHAAAAKHK
jgi:hypothetical protein